MPERNDAETFGLCHAEQIRDRNAGHGVERLDVVELERIDDKLKAIRQSLRCIGLRCVRGLVLDRCCSRT
jgi:hypothetical protein